MGLCRSAEVRLVSIVSVLLSALGPEHFCTYDYVLRRLRGGALGDVLEDLAANLHRRGHSQRVGQACRHSGLPSGPEVRTFGLELFVAEQFFWGDAVGVPVVGLGIIRDDGF